MPALSPGFTALESLATLLTLGMEAGGVRVRVRVSMVRCCSRPEHLGPGISAACNQGRNNSWGHRKSGGRTWEGAAPESDEKCGGSHSFWGVMGQPVNERGAGPGPLELPERDAHSGWVGGQPWGHFLALYSIGGRGGGAAFSVAVTSPPCLLDSFCFRMKTCVSASLFNKDKHTASLWVFCQPGGRGGGRVGQPGVKAA